MQSWVQINKFINGETTENRIHLKHECPKTYGGRYYLSTRPRHRSVLRLSCHEFFHSHDKNGGWRAANFRHRGQIQTGTVPKKLSCKPDSKVFNFSLLPSEKVTTEFAIWFHCCKAHTVCKISERQHTSIPDAERCNCCRSPLFITFKIPHIHFSPLVRFIELTFQYWAPKEYFV